MKNLITTAVIFVLAFVLNILLAVTASAQDLERGDLENAIAISKAESKAAEKLLLEKLRSDFVATENTEIALNQN